MTEFSYRKGHLTLLPTQNGQSRVENEALNNAACQAATLFLKRGLSTMIMVKYKRHGFIVRDILQQRYRCKTVYVDGNTPAAEREELFKRIQNGELFVTVSCPVFNEGVDLPDVRALILLGDYKSEIKAVQRIGRGLRMKPSGDNSVIILDFIHQTNKHLYNHSKLRTSVYAEEQWPVQIINDIQEL